MPDPHVAPRVTSIRIYPVKDLPGLDLTDVHIGEAGLDGDRRKKSPVHLVADTDGPATRANLVLSITVDELGGLVGSEVVVGDVLLAVVRPAGNCPGVYADVIHEGNVSLGDELARVLPPL